MFESIRKNPIYNRLTANSGFPTLSGSIWLGFGLAGVSLVLSVYGLYQFLDTSGQDARIFWAFETSLILYLITPLITVLVVIITIRRDATSEAVLLLQLTPLDKMTYLEGYVSAALYRLRVLFIIHLGLVPVWLLGSIMLMVEVVSLPACSISLTSHACPHLDYWERLEVASPLSTPVIFACIAIITIWAISYISTFIAASWSLKISKDS